MPFLPLSTESKRVDILCVQSVRRVSRSLATTRAHQIEAASKERSRNPIISIVNSSQVPLILASLLFPGVPAVSSSPSSLDIPAHWQQPDGRARALLLLSTASLLIPGYGQCLISSSGQVSSVCFPCTPTKPTTIDD